MKRGRREQEHSVDILFILALFCVFAASAVLVMTFGANVYQHTVSRMEDNYEVRVSLSYLANQLRQHDESGCIILDSLEGQPALVLVDEPGSDYATFIYYYDGALRELYCNRNDPLTADDGLAVVELSDWQIALTDKGCLCVQAVGDDGKKRQLILSIRSGGGEAS